MKIHIKRIHLDPEYTVGNLSIDGQKVCFTLEDAVREKVGVPVSEWKIPGKTAIPAGEYQVLITMSPRFKKMLPRLMGVPGFTGVLIHPGNKSEDTDGCILTGSTWGGGDWITGSRIAFDAVYIRISAAQARGEKVTLTIE